MSQRIAAQTVESSTEEPSVLTKIFYLFLIVVVAVATAVVFMREVSWGVVTLLPATWAVNKLINLIRFKELAGSGHGEQSFDEVLDGPSSPRNLLAKHDRAIRRLDDLGSPRKTSQGIPDTYDLSGAS
jgi:hypothetical protein